MSNLVRSGEEKFSEPYGSKGVQLQEPLMGCFVASTHKAMLSQFMSVTLFDFINIKLLPSLQLSLHLLEKPETETPVSGVVA